MKSIRTIHLLLVYMGLFCLIFSCTGRKGWMTKPLFMQSKRANVAIPLQEGDSTKKSAVLTEVVDYTNPDNDDVQGGISVNDAKKLDTAAVYRLDEVTVSASRMKFVPERNGRVNVNFVVRVPKELLSNQWRMMLTPELICNDSVTELSKIVLKGQDFLDKQKQDYADYDDYIKSIIDTTAYDSAFLNRKQIARDIRSRQLFNWHIYHRQWKIHMAYLRWRQLLEDRYAHFNTKQEGYRNSLYHKYMFNAQELKVRNNIMGKDTVGVQARYQKRFERKAGILPQYWLRRELSASNLPPKYRHIYTSGQTLQDIKNPSMTEQDSIDIARHRYFYGAIAENETKKLRKNDMFKKIVPLPYEQDVLLDSIIHTEHDFIYYYNYSQPVSMGMKAIYVTMKGRVDAIDLSSYTLPKADTLTFAISSLVQLVDTTLAYKAQVERDETGEMVVVQKEVPDYKEGLRLLGMRDYKGALTILDKYSDYNTALCLSGMGYNARAYNILIKQGYTANVEYLLALLLYRLSYEEEAAKSLLRACKKDSSKIFRISLDPEVSELVSKHNLQSQLDEIMLSDGGGL